MNRPSIVDHKGSIVLPSSVSEPTYALANIKAHLRAGRVVLTHKALANAAELGFDRTDVHDCVLALDENDFYKTMESETCRGLMQDVYKPRYLSTPIYVKLQLTDVAVVIQFKRDSSIRKGGS
jgi:hypothetical protein